MSIKDRKWQLLAKKASREASEEELSELERLMEKECDHDNSHDLQDVLNTLENYWHMVQKAPEELLEPRIHQLLTIDKLRRNTDKPTFYPTKSTRSGKKVNLWWKIAAVLICIIAISSTIYYTSFRVKNIELLTQKGKRVEVSLPDGTKVYLNSGSRIVYSKNFLHSANREVTLEGEAYFKVKHDAAHPFIIHTRFLNIEDIGTEFNIKAYPGDKTIEATLIKGSIEVYLKNNPAKKRLLHLNEKLIYCASCAETQSDVKKAAPQNASHIVEKNVIESPFTLMKVQPLIKASGEPLLSETAWLNNELAFRSQRFSDLAKSLERWYNVRIDITDPQIADYIFTGIFEGESIQQALQELQMIRAFNFVINKDEIIISK